MSIHVHLHQKLIADHQGMIRPLLDPSVSMTSGNEIPQETQMLITEHCDAALIDDLDSLKYLLFPFAGVPKPMRRILADRPNISAHNLHYNDVSVAENALALLLAAVKKIVPLDQKMRRGNWTPMTVDTSHALLFGSKCLLLGYGAISRRIAPVLTALGINVTIFKNTPDHNLPYPCLNPDDWKSHLAQFDHLICALPATPKTAQIIDKQVLDLLPSHAAVINVGRGSTIDEEALYIALKSGSIGAAGIDVWWNYPDNFPFQASETAKECYPSKFPYHELENVVMSPHRGADYRIQALQQRLCKMLAERINLAAKGENLPDKINPKRGY